MREWSMVQGLCRKFAMEREREIAGGHAAIPSATHGLTPGYS